MPKLLRSSETAGCGATIELDNGEVVYVSIAQIGVLVRLWDMRGGLIKSFISNFFGPKLYNESSVYKNAQTAQALSAIFPERVPSLCFNNPVLTAFANAIWHCSSASEVCVVLNQAAAKAPQLENEAEMTALQEAFDAAKNGQPPKSPPEMTSATYRVIYSNGEFQEKRFIPIEINRWVTEYNEVDAKGFYRILRILDGEGKIVWQEKD